MRLVATCAAGLEELLSAELESLGVSDLRPDRGAVRFQGRWPMVWKTNLSLRTANRVLAELHSWGAWDNEALYRGVCDWVHRGDDLDGVSVRSLLDPSRTIALHATSSRSKLTDSRWISQKAKDAIVDSQRKLFRRRSDVDRQAADTSLRILLRDNRATLLLDTSGAPLDRRGYRLDRIQAPLRENLAAACYLAAIGHADPPEVLLDPMCGAGTLLAEGAWAALQWAPGRLRSRWMFERLPSFDRHRLRRLLPQPRDLSTLRLHGNDDHSLALRASRANLERAELGSITTLTRQDAFDLEPPAQRGLLLVNPPYGERIADSPEQWSRIGDLLKQRFAGWTAVVIAGDPGKGKFVGLKPKRRIPVRNGALEARILVFELY